MLTRMVVAVALLLGAAQASAAQKEFHASRSETLAATVEKIDAQTREVTLKGEDGAETTFKAAKEVRNLDKVKVGDKVSVTLDQSLTLWILGADQAAPELSVGADVYRAQPGEKPGGLMTADVSGVATVEAIAANKKSVTLKGPRGNSVKLAVHDPKNLDGVAVGTRVGFAYSETLGVDVVAGKPKAQKAPAAKEGEKKGEPKKK
jgi:Cu/Ag efflux protein CusF